MSKLWKLYIKNYECPVASDNPVFYDVKKYKGDFPSILLDKNGEVINFGAALKEWEEERNRGKKSEQKDEEPVDEFTQEEWDEIFGDDNDD